MNGERIIRRLNRRLTPIVLVLLTLLGADLLAAASGHIPTVPVTVTGLDH